MTEPGNATAGRDRLDMRLLRHGAVALYFRPTVLEDDAARLAAEGYRLHRLDAARWRAPADLHDALRTALAFHDGYAANLAALEEHLATLPLPEGGLAVVMERYDAFFRRSPVFAQAVLDAIERASRLHLLAGRRLLALVQSDDPAIRFDAVGALPVSWNPRERAAADRRP